MLAGERALDESYPTLGPAMVILGKFPNHIILDYLKCSLSGWESSLVVLVLFVEGNFTGLELFLTVRQLAYLNN